MKARATLLSGIVCAALATSSAWAHGGGGMDMDESRGDPCEISKGYHTVHFSAYQHLGATVEQNAKLQREEEFQGFCDEVPKTGKTTLTFDLVSDGLRKIPVAVRVVESAEESDFGTVLYIPQQVYPSGVVRAETDFPKVGRYTAILKVEEHPGRSHPGDATQGTDYGGHGGAEAVSQKHASSAEEEAYHAHDMTFSFPFTVGMKRMRVPAAMTTPRTYVLLLGALWLGAGFFVMRAGKKKPA